MLLRLLLVGTCYGDIAVDLLSNFAAAAFGGILATANTDHPVPLPPLNETAVQVRAGTEDDAKYFFSYATLAYCNNSVIQGWGCNSCHAMGPGWQVHEIVQDPALETQAVVAVNRERKEIGISIRGSDNIKNQLQNLLVEQVPLAGLDQTIKAHLGFRNIAQGLLPNLTRSVQPLLTQGGTRDYAIVVTGHSMGGAVALLLALDLQRAYSLPWARFSAYTYGQPRVGNLEFVNHYNSLPLKLTRVVNENDIVPHMPAPFQGYFHTLTELYIHDSRGHLCSSHVLEDEACSRSRVKELSKDAHDFAWDKALNSETCLPYSTDTIN